VSRPKLEVADIFRDHGAAWRSANAGHVSLDQLKVMSAIERCRTAALGGHVERCEKCSHTVIAYNSCRNRHCPKCQGLARAKWLADRQAELLAVPYFHVVFTLPAQVDSSLNERFFFVALLLLRRHVPSPGPFLRPDRGRRDVDRLVAPEHRARGSIPPR
jgi:hypothetical protein